MVLFWIVWCCEFSVFWSDGWVANVFCMKWLKCCFLFVEPYYLSCLILIHAIMWSSEAVWTYCSYVVDIKNLHRISRNDHLFLHGTLFQKKYVQQLMVRDKSCFDPDWILQRITNRMFVNSKHNFSTRDSQRFVIKLMKCNTVKTSNLRDQWLEPWGAGLLLSPFRQVVPLGSHLGSTSKTILLSKWIGRESYTFTFHGRWDIKTTCIESPVKSDKHHLKCLVTLP